MKDMKDFIVSVIEKGDYKLEEIEAKIKKLFILGDLTGEEMDDLLKLAADSVDDSKQIELYQKLINLEGRVEALETVDYVVYTSGYVTKSLNLILIKMVLMNMLHILVGVHPHLSRRVRLTDGIKLPLMA